MTDSTWYTELEAYDDVPDFDAPLEDDHFSDEVRRELGRWARGAGDELDYELRESEDYRAAAAAQDQIMPGVTTGALLDAMEHPERFAEIARGDLYIAMAHMRRQASHPNMPFNQRMQYAQFLSKMGRAAEPDRDTTPFAGIPMIQINLPGTGGSVQIGAARREEEVVSEQ